MFVTNLWNLNIDKHSWCHDYQNTAVSNNVSTTKNLNPKNKKMKYNGRTVVCFRTGFTHQEGLKLFVQSVLCLFAAYSAVVAWHKYWTNVFFKRVPSKQCTQQRVKWWISLSLPHATLRPLLDVWKFLLWIGYLIPMNNCFISFLSNFPTTIFLSF